MSARQPVIIIGMHRSGTTMVTRMLRGLGLFVGAKVDSNCEPPFFRSINDWLLAQCGGRWDQPLPIHYLVEQPALRSLVVEYLAAYLRGPRLVSFAGMRGLTRGGRDRLMESPWGWKDPRNTFTLPLWLDLFPHAKVIHIYRHGIDVANSLVRRWSQSIAKRQERHHARRGLYAVRPQTGGFAESYRCATLEGAMSLWNEYVSEARRRATALGSNAVEVQYETFLDRPAEILARLAEFARVPVTDEQIQRAAAQVRPERAYAYREQSALRDFAAQQSEQLAACGYSA